MLCVGVSRLVKRRTNSSVVALVFIGMVVFSMVWISASRSEQIDEQRNSAHGPDRHDRSVLSPLVDESEDVYRQLERALSPNSARSSACQSVIFPGGKCQCVDVLNGVNAEECEFYPVSDGKKTVCLDVLRPGVPCLVYSFGVKDDVSFETEMVKFGCEVHAFDPTVRLNRTALKAVGVNMHYIGVDGSNWIAHMEGFGDMDMMSLDGIVAYLGHQGRKIDYLKLDVEGSEWDVLQHQLFGAGDVLQNVPQMTIEFHLMFPRGTLRSDSKEQRTLPEQGDAKRFLKMIRGLERAGFQMFESRPDFNNYSGTQLAFIYETAWIRH